MVDEKITGLMVYYYFVCKKKFHFKSCDDESQKHVLSIQVTLVLYLQFISHNPSTLQNFVLGSDQILKLLQ